MKLFLSGIQNHTEVPQVASHRTQLSFFNVFFSCFTHQVTSQSLLTHRTLCPLPYLLELNFGPILHHIYPQCPVLLITVHHCPPNTKNVNIKQKER